MKPEVRPSRIRTSYQIAVTLALLAGSGFYLRHAVHHLYEAAAGCFTHKPQHDWDRGVVYNGLSSLAGLNNTISFSTDATLTGLVPSDGGQASDDGQIMNVCGTGDGNVTVLDEDERAQPHNRFYLQTPQSVITYSQSCSRCCLTFVYDGGELKRWRLVQSVTTTDAAIHAYYNELSTGLTSWEPQWNGSVWTQSVITPPPEIGTLNDYNPTSLNYAGIIRQDLLGKATITGLAGGAPDRVLTINNITTTGGTFLTFTHEDARSQSANRFELPNGTSIALAPGGSISFRYIKSVRRWRLIGALERPVQ